jgi:hypothetical protein
MSKTRAFAVASLFGATLLSSSGLAQESPPPWEASPDVYKVIGETARYRIILATWKPGQIDNPHSHKPGVAVYLTDCNLRNHRPGVAPVDYAVKPGDSRPTSGIASHRTENLGSADCQLIHVDMK